MGHIKSISIHEFDGSFSQVINFEEGLNILSGVNGTGKTTVLKRIRENLGTDRVQKDGTVSKILAFSPKRNAEKKTVQAALQYIRQQSRTSESVLNEANNRAIVDHTFEKYESFGDLYSYEFQDRCRAGGDQIKVMNELTEEYNKVVKSIFPEYEIKTEWNSAQGSPDVKLITRYGVPLDLSLMSCGESEVLALIFNIYFNKNNTDVFLIDEPEVHLNWTLEKGLFTFFDQFALENKKQIIVTSHSRVIFDQAFRKKTQFLVFRDKKVFIEQDPPKEVLEDIAGETISIISTTAPSQKTFFVEDEFHKAMIQHLLDLHSKSAEIVVVKDASGMISNLYKVLKGNHELNAKWINAYLMIDGDGKDEQYKTETRFIHLHRYVAESYFFVMSSMAKSLGISEDDLKTKILELILANKKYFEGRHLQFIEKVLNKIAKEDINLELMSSFDCSGLFSTILDTYGKKRDEFVKSYLADLNTAKEIEKVFDKKLLQSIKV